MIKENLQLQNKCSFQQIFLNECYGEQVQQLSSNKILLEEIYYLVGNIKDPEKQHMTLQSLDIIQQKNIQIWETNINVRVKQRILSKKLFTKIIIKLKPTNPHCHLVQQIALSIHYRLKMELPDYQTYKIRIKCLEGTHADLQNVQKQINDKERISAALENEEIVKFLQKLTIWQ